MRYLKYASEHNDEEAQFWLGMMYYSGIGVAENKQTALSYFKDAARNGSNEAKAVINSSDSPKDIEHIWQQAKQETDESLSISSGSCDMK